MKVHLFYIGLIGCLSVIIAYFGVRQTNSDTTSIFLKRINGLDLVTESQSNIAKSAVGKMTVVKPIYEPLERNLNGLQYQTNLINKVLYNAINEMGQSNWSDSSKKETLQKTHSLRKLTFTELKKNLIEYSKIAFEVLDTLQSVGASSDSIEFLVNQLSLFKALRSDPSKWEKDFMNQNVINQLALLYVYKSEISYYNSKMSKMAQYLVEDRNLPLKDFYKVISSPYCTKVKLGEKFITMLSARRVKYQRYNDPHDIRFVVNGKEQKNEKGVFVWSERPTSVGKHYYEVETTLTNQITNAAVNYRDIFYYEVIP